MLLYGGSRKRTSYFFVAFASHESTHQTPSGAEFAFGAYKKNFKRLRLAFANSKPAQSAEIFLAQDDEKVKPFSLATE